MAIHKSRIDDDFVLLDAQKTVKAALNEGADKSFVVVDFAESQTPRYSVLITAALLALPKNEQLKNVQFGFRPTVLIDRSDITEDVNERALEDNRYLQISYLVVDNQQRPLGLFKVKGGTLGGIHIFLSAPKTWSATCRNCGKVNELQSWRPCSFCGYSLP